MTRFAALCAVLWAWGITESVPAARADTSTPQESSQTAEQNSAKTPREEIVIQTPAPAEGANNAAVIESLTADDIAAAVNMVNTEDALKYLPDVLVRKRHIGDTQAPLATRTSGVGSSARSLIYADGMLLSALIGNNNSSASPRWGMVAPEEIANIEIIYGPFAAAYPGNSIGAVVNITTRMPEHFEASAAVETSWQTFSQYAAHDTYPAQEISALVGDRTDSGRFAWWFSVNHLIGNAQPLAYVTATPGTVAAAATAVTGAIADVNRTGAAIDILGEGGIEHQIEDNVTAKAAYEFTPALSGTYTFGYFRNDDHAHADTYLRDGQGNPVYAGNLNAGGAGLAVPASAFDNNVYAWQEDHWMQGLGLKLAPGGDWEMSLDASVYEFARDLQALPTTALPAGNVGGPGSLVDMAGTGWYTVDLKGIWRAAESQELSGGLHHDGDKLVNNRYSASSWLDTDETGDPLTAVARGNTTTDALWVQDAWRFAPGLTLTAGGRLESWRAFDGFNYSLTPALSVQQPDLAATRFSPKMSLAWQADDAWRVIGNFGVAYRFPTVSELYQTVTTGLTLSVPNPDLKPERAISSEVDVERSVAGTKMRLSLFQENVAGALIAQTAPLVPGSTTLFSYVQNIDQTRARGAEIAGNADDVLIAGLGLSASVTYVDARTTSDPAFAAAVGKQLPQVPAWRGTLVATYRPDDAWSFTAAVRASTRVYATIDNSDSVTHTFQGFDGYAVVDVRAHYDINRHWSAAAGVDNLNDRKYFIFHPFPQRTFTAEMKYSY